jgi:pseudouridine kinase
MAEMPMIVCAGAMLWDMIGHSSARLAPGDDVPGRIRRLPGGVALNIALALARQGLPAAILSCVGRDSSGEALLAEAGRHGIDTRWVWRDSDLPTDSYLAIESPDGLVAAIADVRGVETAGAAILAPLRDGRLGDGANPWPGTLILDGNLTPATISELADDPCLAAADLRIAPASPDKVARLRPLLTHPRAMFHLNRAEAEALTGRRFSAAPEAAEAVIALGASRALVTDGAKAAADACRGATTLTETPPPVAALRVTGAGDTFVAAHIAAERAGASRTEALAAAVRASATHVSGMEQPS